jgi:hypothetical protein
VEALAPFAVQFACQKNLDTRRHRLCKSATCDCSDKPFPAAVKAFAFGGASRIPAMKFGLAREVAVNSSSNPQSFATPLGISQLPPAHQTVKRARRHHFSGD